MMSRMHAGQLLRWVEFLFQRKELQSGKRWMSVDEHARQMFS